MVDWKFLTNVVSRSGLHAVQSRFCPCFVKFPWQPFGDLNWYAVYANFAIHVILKIVFTLSSAYLVTTSFDSIKRRFQSFFVRCCIQIISVFFAIWLPIRVLWPHLLFLIVQLSRYVDEVVKYVPKEYRFKIKPCTDLLVSILYWFETSLAAFAILLILAVFSVAKIWNRDQRLAPEGREEHPRRPGSGTQGNNRPSRDNRAPVAGEAEGQRRVPVLGNLFSKIFRKPSGTPSGSGTGNFPTNTRLSQENRVPEEAGQWRVPVLGNLFSKFFRKPSRTPSGSGTGRFLGNNSPSQENRMPEGQRSGPLNWFKSFFRKPSSISGTGRSVNPINTPDVGTGKRVRSDTNPRDGERVFPGTGTTPPLLRTPPLTRSGSVIGTSGSSRMGSFTPPLTRGESVPENGASARMGSEIPPLPRRESETFIPALPRRESVPGTDANNRGGSNAVTPPRHGTGERNHRGTDAPEPPRRKSVPGTGTSTPREYDAITSPLHGTDASTPTRRKSHAHPVNEIPITVATTRRPSDGSTPLLRRISDANPVDQIPRTNATARRPSDGSTPLLIRRVSDASPPDHFSKALPTRKESDVNPEDFKGLRRSSRIRNSGRSDSLDERHGRLLRTPSHTRTGVIFEPETQYEELGIRN